MPFEKPYLATDAGKNTEEFDKRNPAEADTSEFTSSLETPFVNEIKIGEGPKNPFIGENIAKGINNFRERADKTIGNFSSKTGEVIGTLAMRGGSAFANIQEQWRKGMEQARAENVSTVETMPEQKAQAETANAEAGASVENAKEVVGNINGNEVLQRISDGRSAVKEGVSKTVKANIEKLSLFGLLKEVAALFIKKIIRTAKIKAFKRLENGAANIQDIIRKPREVLEGWKNGLRKKITTYENLQNMAGKESSPATQVAPEAVSAETATAPETPGSTPAENVIDLAAERAKREKAAVTPEAPAVHAESAVDDNNVWGLNEVYVKRDEAPEEFKEAA